MKTNTSDNALRQKMNSSNPVVGTFAHLGGLATVECLGLAGLDFVVIDIEHAPFSMETATDMVRTAELAGVSSVIRVCDHSRPSLHKALNTGASAIVVPCIESVQEIKDMLKEGRFYPHGKHNFPYARNSNYNGKCKDGLQSFYDRENREKLLIPQCETLGCLNHIEEIMAMEGVDGLFFGPFDLTADMGIIGQFDHPDYLEARRRVVKACQDNGKFAWTYSASTGDAKADFSDGFLGSAIGIDTGIYTSAYKQLMSEMND